VKPKENDLNTLEYLQYFYYGGNIFLGLKKFDKALEFFQLALTLPSRVLSAVQVECYKRYILAGLILNGEVTQLPGKLTSQVVLRNIERITQPYVDLQRAFKKGVDAVDKVWKENIDFYKKDHTSGLVKQAIDALVRRNIHRLTNTYITLSLSDIAQSAHLKGPKEAERIVLNMIEDGAIFATINQRDGMVQFLENPEDYDTSQQVNILDSKIQEVIGLSEKLKSVEKSIVLTNKYIVRTTQGLVQNVASGGGGPGGLPAMMGLPPGMMAMMGMGGMGMNMGPMHHMGMAAGGPSAREQEEMEMKMAIAQSERESHM
jgi:COP9 signalosome complex subunit 3